jgi:hypothetical protein
MMWQLSSDLRFRLFGGEAYVPGPNRVAKDWPLTELPVSLRFVFLINRHWRSYATSTNRADLTSALRTFLRDEHVDAVFVRTTSPQGGWVSSLVQAATGVAPQHTTGLDVWTGVS